MTDNNDRVTIDNETRRVILDRIADIRANIPAKSPGRKERAILRAARAIEEIVQ